MQKTLMLCVNWASEQCANHLGCDACTEAVSERSRNGLGTVSERSRRRAHWHGRAKVSQGLNCVAGAALSQGQVSISWQAWHFRNVKYTIRGRRITFGRSSTEFVAGAALSQGQVQNSWHAQHFRKVKYRFCGRRSTLARSSTDLVAGGRRSIFARSTFAAGARKSQLLSAKVVREVNFRSWGLKIATFKYESSAQSLLSQPGLENRNLKVRK